MHAARDQIVTGAFRRRADEVRRLDVEEALALHEGSDKGHQTAPEHDLLLELRTAEIKIAVFQADIFPRVDPVLHRIGRRQGLGEDPERLRSHLHGSGFKIRIHRAAALFDDAGHRDAELAPKSACPLVVSLKYDLHDARAVPEIDEDDAALVSAFCDPAHESHFLPDHGLRDFTAPACASQAFD